METSRSQVEHKTFESPTASPQPVNALISECLTPQVVIQVSRHVKCLSDSRREYSFSQQSVNFGEDAISSGALMEYSLFAQKIADTVTNGCTDSEETMAPLRRATFSAAICVQKIGLRGF